MSSWKLRGAALGTVLALVVAGAAQASGGHTSTGTRGGAAGRTLDPGHLPRVLPHGVFRVAGSTAQVTSGRTTTTTNGLIVSDLAMYVSNGTTFTSLAAEGHLALHHDTGGHYVGTFMDDLSGGAIFKASASGIQATGLNGHYTLATGNGTFTFTIGSTFTSTVPSKYGSSATIGTILYGAHAYTLRPALQATLGTLTIGRFHRPVTGTLTLTTDAIGYIVPFSAQRRVNSSWAYFSGGSLHTYHLTSAGRYYPPDGAGDGSLTTVVAVGKYLFSLVDVHEDSGGQSTLSGNAITGSGGATSLVSFSAH